VLLLAPSSGLGSGIERYTETLEWAFAAQGIESARVDLGRPGFRGHARMLAQARTTLRRSMAPARLVAVHRALLPVAWLLAREVSVSGISVVCHGGEVWGARHRPRWYLENRLMRRPAIRVVAVSSFTAGALAGISPATVLAPGLSQAWFRTLAAASSASRPRGHEIRLITAFRLADWRSKGLPELLSAVAALQRPDVRVIVCGTGEPPPELRRLVSRHRHCTLRPNLSDQELAGQLAAADLFVLATRTRSAPNPSGEGFGLVLLEAQVAGTPVVGPAYGGSHSAFVDRITGAAPADETAEALTALLAELLKDPQQLARMGMRATDWTRECFAPERYASQAVARLL
jgi:glycosyltransferase involved in cell wall biosynthesis